MGFVHIQGKSSAVTSSLTTTIALVLDAAPSLGSTVCVGFTVSDPHTISGLSIKDANNNVYTITPNSPSPTDNVTVGYTYVAYLLNAPANASATINASWTTVGTAIINKELFADEFSVTGGTAAFDKDIGSDNGLVAGTAVNAPTITPTGTNELLYAAAQVGGTISTANGVWTGSAGVVQNGNWAEYDLSASSAQAINFTQSPSSKWSAMAMAFTFTPSAAQQDSYQPIYADYHWLGGDE